jgi:translation elongation factor EF-Ts
MLDRGRQVIGKIVEGKLSSFFQQSVLVDQPSIRDRRPPSPR